MSGQHNPSSTSNTPSGPPRPFPFAQQTHASSSPAPSTHTHTPVQPNDSNTTSSARSGGAPPSSAVPSGGGSLFTPSMRDRQARGKDPYSYGSHPHYNYSQGCGSDPEDSDPGFDDREEDDEDGDVFDPQEFRAGKAFYRNGSGPGGNPRREHARAASGSTRTYHPRPPHQHHHHHHRPTMHASGRQKDESWESWRRRETAQDILNSPELLMWYASSRDDSVPSTRLHFTRILCGYGDDAESPRRTEHASSGGGKRRKSNVGTPSSRSGARS